MLCTSFKNHLLLLTVAYDWFLSPLPITVDKPKPFSPRQRAKYTSYDEASSAPALWTSKHSAQIWLWNQEEPPKRLYSIFHHLSQAWQGAWTSRSVTGLAFWPAFGSAGRARSNELVSKLFLKNCFVLLLHILQSVSVFFVSEQQELVGQIEATQHCQQRQDMQRDLERLVARMEEKGAQITKLRKHQQTVCYLSLSKI